MTNTFAARATVSVIAAKDLYYHGGTYSPGTRLTRPLYVTKSLDMARSYREMSKDRFGKGSIMELRITLVKKAPNKAVIDACKQVGIDFFEHTPASVFDSELNGLDPVNQLVRKLRGLGYDLQYWATFHTVVTAAKVLSRSYFHPEPQRYFR